MNFLTHTGTGMETLARNSNCSDVVNNTHAAEKYGHPAQQDRKSEIYQYFKKRRIKREFKPTNTTQ